MSYQCQLRTFLLHSAALYFEALEAVVRLLGGEVLELLNITMMLFVPLDWQQLYVIAAVSLNKLSEAYIRVVQSRHITS